MGIFILSKLTILPTNNRQDFQLMFKKKLTLSDYFLIAANLLPVVGVWAWGWSPEEMFLVYCLETIIIGIFNLGRMAIVTLIKKTDNWYANGKTTRQSGLFFMLFFLVHYGFFVGVQMSIFFGVSGIGKGSGINAFNFFYKWPQLLHNDSLIVLGIFVFCYCYKMIIEFILSGEYRSTPLMMLMFQPYGRIFVQQFTVIVGSMFLSFGAGKVFILVFATIKIFFELFINYAGLLNKGMKEVENDSGKQ
jgi:Family of unknown function (DUF6498)